MRKFSLFVVALLALSLGLHAQESDSLDLGFLSQLDHPRLLMSAEDFVRLRDSLAADENNETMLGKMDALVVGHAETCLRTSKPIRYELDASGRRLLDQSRRALDRIFCCSYAYKVSGREEFLQRVLEDLHTVCDFPDWHPSHFLDVGEMSLAVAMAYDWLYDKISPQDRDVIEDRLVRYALKPSTKQWFHKSIGNWNQVCNCGIVAAAIAVYGRNPELCGQIINNAIADNRVANEGIYAPDGNYPEGYNYWGYGTSFEVLLIAMLEHACGSSFGLADTPGFMQTGEYMLFMSGAAGTPFPYADGGSITESSKGGMWWFAAKQHDPGLLLNEWRIFEQGRYLNGGESRLLAMVPCFILNSGFRGLDKAKPSKEIWYGRGLIPVVMVHTGWNFDEGDIYLGIKGGRAKHNHGHQDAGSFVFDSQGTRWSEDLMQLPYAKMEVALKAEGGNFWKMGQGSLRWDIFRMNCISHSTLIFLNTDGSIENKVHPSDHVVNGNAYLEEVYEEPGNYGAKLDMTEVFSDQADTVTRTFRLEGEDLYIIDEVRAKPGMDATMQWRMLTQASVEMDKRGEVLSRDGKTLYLRAYNNATLPMEYELWEARRPESWEPRDWDPDDSNYRIAGFSATIPAGSTATFTTILTADKRKVRTNHVQY